MLTTTKTTLFLKTTMKNPPTRLTKKRKLEIELYIEIIQSVYKSDSPITDLQAIIEGENIYLIYDDFNNDFEASITYETIFFVIFININTLRMVDAIRLIFSLAHEIAHYLIPEHNKYLRTNLIMQKVDNGIESDSLREKEAEYGASCLLMPRAKITEDFNSEPISIQMLMRVKEKYMVSLTAVLKRYKELGPTPIMIIYCNDGKVNNDKYAEKSKNFIFSKPITDDQLRLPSRTLAVANSTSGISFEPMSKIHPTSDLFRQSYKSNDPKHMVELCFDGYTENSCLSVVFELTGSYMALSEAQNNS
jgi:Zn-dependent peptidase ImmA (M78 family)